MHMQICLKRMCLFCELSESKLHTKSVISRFFFLFLKNTERMCRTSFGSTYIAYRTYFDFDTAYRA